jgi:hypothetical protein
MKKEGQINNKDNYKKDNGHNKDCLYGKTGFNAVSQIYIHILPYITLITAYIGEFVPHRERFSSSYAS